MTMMNRKLTLLAAGLVLVAVACTSAEPAPTTAVSTSVVSTSTSPSTVPTTVAPTTTLAPTTTTVSIPLPDNRGDDWLRIVSELQRFSGWAFENPSLDHVAVWAAPGGPIEERFTELMAEFVEKGWRTVPGGLAHIYSVELISVDADEAVVLAVLDFDGDIAVDADGNEVMTFESQPKTSNRLVLHWDDDAGWRTFSGEFVAFVGGDDG